ncbi:hypothetical protein [Escherichia coli]
MAGLAIICVFIAVGMDVVGN